MLVISRKKNQRMMLADGEIVITIVEIRGDKVKLGIDAAHSISVDREEIFEAKKKEMLANGSQNTLGQAAHAPGQGGEGVEDRAGGSKELLCNPINPGTQRKPRRRA